MAVTGRPVACSIAAGLHPRAISARTRRWAPMLLGAGVLPFAGAVLMSPGLPFVLPLVFHRPAAGSDRPRRRAEHRRVPLRPASGAQIPGSAGAMKRQSVSAVRRDRW